MIKKTPDGKYRVIGNNTGKNLGTFNTKAAANHHQLQVQYFMYGQKKSQKK